MNPAAGSEPEKVGFEERLKKVEDLLETVISTLKEIVEKEEAPP